jgi:hypothetical protein
LGVRVIVSFSRSLSNTPEFFWGGFDLFRGAIQADISDLYVDKFFSAVGGSFADLSLDTHKNAWNSYLAASLYG